MSHSIVRPVLAALGLLWLPACAPPAGLDPRDSAERELVRDTATPWERPDCQAGIVCDEGLCWSTICGGRFDMGSLPGQGDADELPQRSVVLRAFELLVSEVTVAQYRLCVDDGACEPWPASDDVPSRCSWDELDQDDHPMNCLDWSMASSFCGWAGAYLPTEAEWEYAARSRGRDVRYPWGDAEPACGLLQMHEEDCCGMGTTCPVCTFPEGNTEQGLCDMAGNIFEWTADWYHGSYLGAPRSAEAWDSPASTFRTMRGGAISSGVGYRVRNRTFHEPDFFYSGMGVRCARPWIPLD